MIPAALQVEGLNVTLSYLDAGPFAMAVRGRSSSIANLKEFVDFIRRVRIPYYASRGSGSTIPESLRTSEITKCRPFTPEKCKQIATDPDYDH